MHVWLTIEIIAALYVISFVWFWSLCRLSVPDKPKEGRLKQESKLIPFERGMKLNIRRNIGI